MKNLPAALLALLLCACAQALPAEKMSLKRSILTADMPTDTFGRSDRTHFRVGDAIHLISIVQWPNSHTSAGRHMISWRWYKGQAPLAAISQQVEMIQTPYELYGEMLASELGPGEHRVECLIEQHVIDSRDFVVEN